MDFFWKAEATNETHQQLGGLQEAWLDPELQISWVFCVFSFFIQVDEVWIDDGSGLIDLKWNFSKKLCA